MIPSRQNSFRACFSAVLCSAFILFGGTSLYSAGLSGETPGADITSHVIQMAEIDRGLCSVLGGDNRLLALELARTGKFVVNVLDPDNSMVEITRKAADGKGLYGKAITAGKSSLKRLPYADNSVDLIVTIHLTGEGLNELSASEILRVLRPHGKAFLGSVKGRLGDKGALSADKLNNWLKSAKGAESRSEEDDLGLWAVLTKPALEGADDWTHWEHGPDNNPVSKDTAIKAPYMTQSIMLPYYIAMPAITTVAGGRIFTALGHIAHHEREEPWLNTLIVQNGYNGTELWRRKLPDGYLVHRSAFIATGNTFYMINPEGNGCLLLDPETGEEKDRIHIPELTGEWKWMAIDDGILYALLGEQKDPPQTTIVRSSARAWSWDDLSTGYYEERIPWGFGNTILAYDLDRKKVLWTHTEDASIDSRAMVIGDSKIFFYCPDSRLGSLNARTGKLLWKNSDPRVRELIEEPGRGLVSTPGWRTTCFSLYTPKALFFEAQTRMNVVAVSNTDGSFMWHRKKTSNNPNMLYVDGNLLVGIGPGGNVQVIDPATGATLEDLGFKKRSCVRVTACWDSYFCRGWPEGLTRYDRLAKKVLFNGALRPSCNDGVIPANGLLYVGPWACDCNLSLMGRVVMCSAGDFNFEPKVREADRLEPGRKALARVASFDISDKDWVTYRGNNARSSCSLAEVPAQAEKIWELTPQSAVRPSAPTAAGGLVFLCGDDCKLRAIDAATGKLKWTFLAGGPLMQPPTLWQGRAYLGAGDGYIYALEAATGKMLWRFRAAPVHRKIMLYGSLCSTWPVNSGVLVEDGVAYAAAGLIDYDGTYVYALDAVTGKIKWQNNSSGHLDKSLRKGISAQGVLTIGQGRLWMPGGNVVSPASYDLATGKYLGGQVDDGSPKANRGEDIGIIGGKYLIHGGRLRYSATENVVNPGYFAVIDISESRQSDKGLPLCNGKIPPAWDDQRIVMLYSGDWFADGRYIAPGCYSMDKIEEYLTQGDEKIPESDWVSKKEATGRLRESGAVSFALAKNAVLEVYETLVVRHRKSRWTLRAMEPDNGKLLWEQRLPSPALPGGLLVDRQGRVIVVMENGTVACYGAKGAI